MQVENSKKKIARKFGSVAHDKKRLTLYSLFFFTRATDFAEIEMLVVYVCPVS